MWHHAGRPHFLLFALMLLALPSAAHAHLYALPTAIVTVPVTLLALLLFWPLKAGLTMRVLERRFPAVLGVQFLSSVVVLLLFVLVQVTTAAPLWIGSNDLVRAIVSPLAALFWMGNYADHVQWWAIIAGTLFAQALFMPAWLLETRLLNRQAPAEQHAAQKRTLFAINLAFFALIALINAAALYYMALSCMENEA